MKKLRLNERVINLSLVLILAIITPTFVQAQELSNNNNTNSVVSSVWDYVKSFLSIFAQGQTAYAGVDVGPQCPRKICGGGGGNGN